MISSRLAAGVVGLVASALSLASWSGDAPVSTPVQAGGADLFLRKGCASCHNGPHTMASVPVGPSLANVAEWAGERKPGVSAGDYVTESIINPPVFISPEFRQSGPTEMPSLELTETEVEALVAYLLDSEPLLAVSTAVP